MSQETILREVYLALFADARLQELLLIPEGQRGELAVFRDRYCVTDINPVAVLDSDVAARLVVNWDEHGTTRTPNPDVLVRTLLFVVNVRRDRQYDVGENALDRRQDAISRRLRVLLHKQRISGFYFQAFDQGDLLSNSADYVRSFVSFQVKNIF